MNQQDIKDDAFFAAHDVLLRALEINIDDTELNRAAAIVTEYAFKHGDETAIKFFLARFSDFINADISPPFPMLQGLSKVFEKYRVDGLSMDAAFFAQRGKGRPQSIGSREWARTDASLVSHFRDNENTLEKAIAKTAHFRAHGREETKLESTIKRNYLKSKKRIKK